MDCTAHPRGLRDHAGGGGDNEIITIVGIVIGGFGHYSAAYALIFAGTGSMLAAAVVLLASSPDKARAAVMQGTFPLLAIVLLVLHLTIQ